MSVRVTSTSLSRSVMEGFQANLSRLQQSQAKMSSGRRVSTMSDSPVDAATAMRLQTDKAANDQAARNIDDGLQMLSTADTAFGSASTMIQRVRQLVVSGRSETLTPEDREAIAVEVDQLRSSLLDQANTTYLGRPIFGGTQEVSQAFDTTTGQYLGNGDAVQRSVSGDGSTRLGVSVTGDVAFSTLFSDSGGPGILDRISTALRDPAGPGGLDAELANLDAASATMQKARSLVGARYNQLLGIQSSTQARADAITGQLSKAQDIDLAQMAIDVQIQSTAYQAALGSAAKIIQPSLLDFLR